MEDILQLPCMRGSRVVSGQNMLKQPVEAVSVLEYTDSSALQDDIFKSIEEKKNELAISGLISVKDDIDAQCDVIRRLHSYGDVGLLLYYVGVFIKEIDQRVIDTAAELNFILICMPENDSTLRYSDAISEIVTAIYGYQVPPDTFITDILKKVASLPESSRRMDTLLQMLAERTAAIIELRDKAFYLLNRAASSTLFSSGPEDSLVRQLLLEKTASGTVNDFYYSTTPVSSRNSKELYLVILQKESAVSNTISHQISEAVQFFINIWSNAYGRADTEELLRALLMDEPIKIHNLSAKLSIDLSQLQGMLFIFSGKKDSGLAQQLLKTAANQCIAAKPLLAETFNGMAVLGVKRELFRSQHAFMNSIGEAVHEIDKMASVFVCYYLPDVSSIHESWILLDENAELTTKLYPEHKWFSLQEVEFSATCAKIISSGETAVRNKLKVLAPLDVENQPLRNDLYKTLSVYLLDAGSNIAETATRMYLHRNTIKYRIHKISEDLGYRPDEMPEERAIYLAVALRRLLNL